MRSLIAVTILCLTSTSAFACVVDTDCESGTMCLDGTHGLSSDIGDGNAPPKRATGKTCGDDGDCSPGSRCIKGSGQRVSASATEAAEVTKAAAEVGPAAQTVASPRVTLSRIASLSLAIFC